MNILYVLSLWVCFSLAVDLKQAPTSFTLLSEVSPDEHPESFLFSFHAYEQEFLVEAKKNINLFSENYEELVWDGERFHVRQSGAPALHCWYHGSVKNSPSSIVALNTCNGLQGLVHAHGMRLEMKPASTTHLQANMGNTKPSSFHDAHSVEAQEEISLPCGNKDHDHETHDLMSRAVDTAHSMKLQAYAENYLIEMLAVNDQAHVSKYASLGSVVQNTINVVNVAAAIYSNQANVNAYGVTTVAGNLNMMLSGQVTLQAQLPGAPSPDANGETDANLLLDAFKNYVGSNKNTLPNHDSAHLMSGTDFTGSAVGLAWVGCMCDSSCTGIDMVTKYSSTVGGAVLAHEVGHNMGLNHDSGTCPSGLNVMSPSVCTNCNTFSSCSVDVLNSNFNLNRYICLEGTVEPTCSDGKQNGDEIAMDCGGSCPACTTCNGGLCFCGTVPDVSSITSATGTTCATGSYAGTFCALTCAYPKVPSGNIRCLSDGTWDLTQVSCYAGDICFQNTNTLSASLQDNWSTGRQVGVTGTAWLLKPGTVVNGKGVYQQSCFVDNLGKPRYLVAGPSGWFITNALSGGSVYASTSVMYDNPSLIPAGAWRIYVSSSSYYGSQTLSFGTCSNIEDVDFDTDGVGNACDFDSPFCANLPDGSAVDYVSGSTCPFNGNGGISCKWICEYGYKPSGTIKCRRDAGLVMYWDTTSTSCVPLSACVSSKNGLSLSSIYDIQLGPVGTNWLATGQTNPAGIPIYQKACFSDANGKGRYLYPESNAWVITDAVPSSQGFVYARTVNSPMTDEPANFPNSIWDVYTTTGGYYATITIGFQGCADPLAVDFNSNGVGNACDGTTVCPGLPPIPSGAINIDCPNIGYGAQCRAICPSPTAGVGVTVCNSATGTWTNGATCALDPKWCFEKTTNQLSTSQAGEGGTKTVYWTTGATMNQAPIYRKACSNLYVFKTATYGWRADDSLSAGSPWFGYYAGDSNLVTTLDQMTTTFFWKTNIEGTSFTGWSIAGIGLTTCSALTLASFDSNSNRIADACEPPCPSGQFPNPTTCSPCPSISSCVVTVTCTSATSATCFRCAPGTYRQVSAGANDLCVPCKSGCATCLDGSYCTSCTSPSILNEYLQCSAPACITGSGPAACASCEAGLCSTCNSGSYVKNGACVPFTCTTGPALTACATCVASTALTADHQCSSCNVGAYLNGFSCLVCNDVLNCAVPEVCNGADDQSCSSCSVGFYSVSLIGGADQCILCNNIDGCESEETCNTDQDTACGSCSTGRYRLQTAGQPDECVVCPTVPNCEVSTTCFSATIVSCSECNPGYYRVSNSLAADTCQQCELVTNCASSTTCTGPAASQCFDCVSGFSRKINAGASDTCEPYSCVTGSSATDCATCVNAASALQSNHCASCNAGSYLSGANCVEKTCTSTNEFGAPANCGANSVCTNEGQGYTCQCATGFFGQAVLNSAGSCSQCAAVDYCAVAVTCSSLTNSKCAQCNSGFALTVGTADTCTAYLCSTNTGALTDCASCVPLASRTQNDQCASCNSGAYLSNGACRVCSAISYCASAPTCGSAGSSDCAACDTGFFLTANTGSNDVCTACATCAGGAEPLVSCSATSQTVCAISGDGICGAGEDCNSVPQDCPKSSSSCCGDLACNGPETEVSCPIDCLLCEIAGQFDDSTGAGCVNCRGPCGANEFEAVSCTSSTNRQCSACSVCGTGSYKTAACTAAADTQCSACTVCAAGKYSTTLCGSTSDTLCSVCATKCPIGTGQSAPCSPTNDLQCNAVCVSGSTWNDGLFAQCQVCSTCPGGQVVEACTARSNTVCPVCGDGVCDSGETCTTCSQDCFSDPGTSGYACGNGVCELGRGENCVNCAADCAKKTSGKTGLFCCGVDGNSKTQDLNCGDSRCSSSGYSCSSAGPTSPSCCGSGGCTGSENEFNCAVDCAAAASIGNDVSSGSAGLAAAGAVVFIGAAVIVSFRREVGPPVRQFFSSMLSSPEQPAQGNPADVQLNVQQFHTHVDEDEEAPNLEKEKSRAQALPQSILRDPSTPAIRSEVENSTIGAL